MCLSTSVPRHHYFRNTSPWQLYIAIDVVGSSVSVYVYVSLCISVSVDISFSLSFDCRLSLTLETIGLHCQRPSTNYISVASLCHRYSLYIHVVLLQQLLFCITNTKTMSHRTINPQVKGSVADCCATSSGLKDF